MLIALPTSEGLAIAVSVFLYSLLAYCGPGSIRGRLVTDLGDPWLEMVER
jgi:hypothetical protein